MREFFIGCLKQCVRNPWALRLSLPIFRGFQISGDRDSYPKLFDFMAVCLTEEDPRKKNTDVSSQVWEGLSKKESWSWGFQDGQCVRLTGERRHFRQKHLCKTRIMKNTDRLQREVHLEKEWDTSIFHRRKNRKYGKQYGQVWGKWR